MLIRPPTAEPACLQSPPLHSPILLEDIEGAAVHRLPTETYWYNSKLKYMLDLSMNILKLINNSLRKYKGN